MPGDEQKIENESTIIAEQNEVRKKQDNNEKDVAQLRLREERKRALVAEAIKSNPTFKNIQQATSQNGIRLNLDRIVDIYFKLSPDDNNLQNANYFNISENSIKMTIQNVITTVNKTENGLVLHSNGEINPEASKIQRAKMLAEENDAEFAKQYGEQLNENIFTFEKPEDFKSDNVLKRLSSLTTDKEMREFWESENGKKVAEETLYNDKEKDERINKARSLSNIQDEDELKVWKIAQQLKKLVGKPGLTSGEAQEMANKLLELEAMLDGKAAIYESDTEKGTIDIDKLLADHNERTKQYLIKENLKAIKSMGKNSYQNFTVEQKREALEALITLVSQDDSKDGDDVSSKDAAKNRSDAMLVLTMIDGVTKWDPETRQRVIDKEGLIAEYNTVSRITIKSMTDLKREIAKNQDRLIDEHLEVVEKDFKVRTNEEAAIYQGSDRFGNNSNTYKEYEASTNDIPNNNQVKGNQQFTSYSSDSKKYEESAISLDKKNITKKLTLREKIDRKLRECYKKAKVYKASQDIETMLGYIKSGDEVKKALIIQSYQVISQPESQMEKRLKNLLADPNIPERVKRNLRELPKIEQERDEKGNKLPKVAKSKMNNEQINQILDSLDKDNSLINGPEIAKILNFTSTYKAIQTMDVKRTKEFLAHYMAQDPENYGTLFGTGQEGEHREVNDSKVASYITNHIKNNEELKEKLADCSLNILRVDEGKMIETIMNVAEHKRTPEYLIRGSIEVAKDLVQATSRRISASKAVMFFLHPIKGTKFLEEAKVTNINIEDKRTETYKSSMNKIKDELKRARVEKEQTAGERAQQAEIPDTFDTRYKVEQEDLGQAVEQSQQVSTNKNKDKEAQIVAIGRAKLIEIGMDKDQAKQLPAQGILEAMKKFNIVVELNEVQETSKDDEAIAVPVTANGNTQGMDR